jgi:pimeloyl-ACP methyl ester carboxylesterase
MSAVPGSPPPGAGATDELVVLLHGFPQTPAAWRDVMPALASAGYRAEAPWARGYGTDPAPRRAELRLEALATDVVALADRLGASRFHVVGHDWGAAVGWRLAAAHPDRVATLTALSVPHPGALLAALPTGQALRSAYVAFFRLPELPERVLGAGNGRLLRAVLRQGGLPDTYAREYVDHLVGHGALSGALGWYRANGPGELRSVGPVTVPTLFLWGRHDPAIGRAAAEGCERFVRGPYRFEELDEGHWLPERQPAAVAEALLGHLGRTPAGEPSAPGQRADA